MNKDEKSAAKRSKTHTIYKNADGKRLPGVTTITGVMDKPALVPWANKLGLQGIESRNYVDILAGIGTLAHAMVSEDMGGDPVNKDIYSKEDISLAENSFIKYLDWRKAREIEVIGTEMQMVSEKYQYGGTCDILAKLDGELTLIDVKTCKGIYSDHFTQVAGYSIALEENGHDIKARGILKLGRNEEEGFQYYTMPCYELHKKRFLICRDLYELNKQIRKEGK